MFTVKFRDKMDNTHIVAMASIKTLHILCYCLDNSDSIVAWSIASHNDYIESKEFGWGKMSKEIQPE